MKSGQNGFGISPISTKRGVRTGLRENKKIHQNPKDFAIDQDKIWLYGKHPTFTILQKKRRQIYQILATKNTIQELEAFLNKVGNSYLLSSVKIVDNRYIETLVGKDAIHQGLAVSCSKLPLKSQSKLLEEIAGYIQRDKDHLPTILLLDQITDPHNIGAIIRSALSFGVRKIVFCQHNAPKETATMCKTSAGTIEMADLYLVGNFAHLLLELRKLGYFSIGLAGEAKTTINEISRQNNLAIVIGSEGEGIRPLVKKNCDQLVKISISPQVESLNASVASAIALYQITNV